MKIEWTDAACEALCKAYANQGFHSFSQSMSRRDWTFPRAVLNAATAEQFRPETPEAAIDRMRKAMRDAREELVNGDPLQAIGILGRALSHGSKESGT